MLTFDLSQIAEISYRMNISSYFFRSKPLPDVLPPAEARFLKSLCKTKAVRKAKELFAEATYPKGVFILRKGKVKIYQRTPDGSEQIIYIAMPGDMFGYRPILCNEKHPVSASTIEDCNFLYVSKDDFLSAIDRYPAIARILLENLSYEFTVWVNIITSLGQRSVKERLAINLLILIEKYRGQKKWPVEIQLSRRDLAGMVGTSIETLARLITWMSRNRIILLRGRTIVITGSDQAKKLANLII